MTSKNAIERSEREGIERKSTWDRFKVQLNFWALALDYDPLEDTHKRESSLNSEVERLKSRIMALELQMSPPTSNLD